jgi:hypothetical protein
VYCKSHFTPLSCPTPPPKALEVELCSSSETRWCTANHTSPPCLVPPHPQKLWRWNCAAHLRLAGVVQIALHPPRACDCTCSFQHGPADVPAAEAWWPVGWAVLVQPPKPPCEPSRAVSGHNGQFPVFIFTAKLSAWQRLQSGTVIGRAREIPFQELVLPTEVDVVVFQSATKGYLDELNDEVRKQGQCVPIHTTHEAGSGPNIGEGKAK